MPFTALAAGIAATGALVGSAVKNRMDKRRYERQLSDQQKMWQQANSYNSPAAQRQRLQDAGLNPNLVYQNGGATPTSDTVTPPSYAESPLMDFTPAAQLVQNSDLVQAQIDKTTAEAQGLNYENIFKLAHSKHVDEETKRWLTGLALNNLETETRIKSLEASTGLTRAEAQNAMLNWFKISADIKEVTSRAQVNEKTVEHLNSLIVKTNAETDLTIKQYEMAIINKSLLAMQEMAERKADKNSYELAIENLEQTLDGLQFANSEISRRKQLVPSMNVPEQQNIYREYRGKPRIEDVVNMDLSDIRHMRQEERDELLQELKQWIKNGHKPNNREKRILRELEN